MTPKEFEKASLTRLEELTGFHASRWSRYINGRVAMNERTLLRAAACLEMEPTQLLQALYQRRGETQLKNV